MEKEYIGFTMQKCVQSAGRLANIADPDQAALVQRSDLSLSYLLVVVVVVLLLFKRPR